MNKPTFPISIIVFLLILTIIFFVVLGGIIYFVFNPSDASIQGRLVKKYIDQKVETIDHSIYLRAIQDPDKDKDGLTDAAETQVYKTNPAKFDSNGTGVGDGEYIYNIYKKAFETDNRNLIARYQQNLDTYKKSFSVSSSSSQLFETLSLNDAFSIRALETYNLYVGMPDDMVQTVKQALDVRQKGDYVRSLGLLQDALSKNPNSSILKYHIGLTYHGMKQYDKALVIYKSIVDDPLIKSPLLYSDIASADYAIGDENGFVKNLQLSIKNFPEDLNQYLILASYYQDKNELDKAEQILNDGLKIEPRYADYYNALAIIAGLKGDNKTEFDLYKKAVSYDFRYAPGHLNLAILYDQFFNNQNSALIEARIAYELDPTPRHLSQIILLYNETGNTVKAKELEGQFLKMKDIDGGSYNNIGLMYLDKENYKQAEFYFRKAIEVMPRLSNAYNNLGIVLSSINRNEEAAVNYKKAIEINPNYANAYSNLGIYFTDKQQYPQAIESFEKAIRLNSSLWRPYQSLGYVYWLLNDKVKEKFYYQKAVEFGCKDPTVIGRLEVLNQ